jgi:hypothetical protein
MEQQSLPWHPALLYTDVVAIKPVKIAQRAK